MMSGQYPNIPSTGKGQNVRPGIWEAAQGLARQENGEEEKTMGEFISITVGKIQRIWRIAEAKNRYLQTF